MENTRGVAIPVDDGKALRKVTTTSVHINYKPIQGQEKSEYETSITTQKAHANAGAIFLKEALIQNIPSEANKPYSTESIHQGNMFKMT